jgi:hypothetical protein
MDVNAITEYYNGMNEDDELHATENPEREAKRLEPKRPNHHQLLLQPRGTFLVCQISFMSAENSEEKLTRSWRIASLEGQRTSWTMRQ